MVYCRKTNPSGQFICLESADELTLSWLAMVYERIEVRVGLRDCERCQVDLVAPLRQRINRVNEFLTKINRPSVVFCCTETSSLSRRDFFSLLTLHRISTTDPAEHSLPDYADARTRLLQRLAVMEQLDEMSSAAPLFYGAKVEPMCTLCGLCVKICKQGAWAIRDTDTHGYLYHCQRNCSGCEQCETICPEQAIRISPEYSRLQVIQNGMAMELISHPYGRCPTCGRKCVTNHDIQQCYICYHTARLNRRPALY